MFIFTLTTQWQQLLMLSIRAVKLAYIFIPQKIMIIVSNRSVNKGIDYTTGGENTEDVVSA